MSEKRGKPAGPTLHFRTMTGADQVKRVHFFILESGKRVELGWIDFGLLHAAGDEGREQWLRAMERLYGAAVIEATGEPRVRLWRDEPKIGRRKANPNPGHVPEGSQHGERTDTGAAEGEDRTREGQARAPEGGEGRKLDAEGAEAEQGEEGLEG